MTTSMSNPANLPNAQFQGPDERGFFGLYGGQFVSETLMPLILDLDKAYKEAKEDPAFHDETGPFCTSIMWAAKAHYTSPSA